MTTQRRDLLHAAAALAAVTLLAKSAGAQGHALKLGKGLRDLSDETLDFFKMLGVKHVVMPSRYSIDVSRRGLVPASDGGPQDDRPLQPWDEAELERIKDRIKEKGLTPMMIHLGRMYAVMHGRSNADEEIEAVKQNI